MVSKNVGGVVKKEVGKACIVAKEGRSFLAKKAKGTCLTHPHMLSYVGEGPVMSGLSPFLSETSRIVHILE